MYKRRALGIQQILDTFAVYDRYQKAREGLNIEEAMVIKKSALDVTGFAKLLRTVYIDENAACSTETVSYTHLVNDFMV